METQYDGELPVGFAFDQAMKIENLDPDRELRFHRASFTDRNNNRVGMHYQQQWPHKNEAQLCAGIRTKAYSAKFMVFPQDLTGFQAGPRRQCKPGSATS